MSLTFDDEIRARAERIAELVISKQHDYGKNNIMNSVIDPKLSLAVRLQDKLARWVSLSDGTKEAKNESLSDTADDIVGYGLLAGMIVDDTFKLPMAEK